MESLNELIGILLNSMPGTILLYTVVLGIMGIVLVPLVRTLISVIKGKGLRVGKFRIGEDVESKGDSEESSSTINKKKIDKKTLEGFISSVEGVYEEYTEKRIRIEKEINEKFTQRQEYSLEKAIDSLVLRHTDLDEDLAHQDLLSLYLSRDFTYIMSKAFNSVKDSRDLLSTSDIDKNYIINEVSLEVLNAMKLKINKYKLLNINSIRSLFEKSSDIIGENIRNTISDFCNLSTEEQEKVSNLKKTRAEKIENLILTIIGE